MKGTIALGEWLPDQPILGDGLEECQNVVAQPQGYRFYPGAATASLSAASGSMLGATTFFRSDGTPVVCVGTTTDLSVIVGGSIYAASLGLSATSAWTFEQFDTAIYASNETSGLFYLTDIESDTSFSAAPGSPPKARAMARVGDFLVLGDVDDGTAYPYRIQWSPFNNPQGTWGTDIATQSGFVDMPERYGPVRAISSGETALVFQSRGFSRLVPGGSGAFQKQVVEEGRGTDATRAVVEFGPFTYFVSDDGIYRTSGGPAENITAGRCWERIKTVIGTANLTTAVAAVDWRYRCVMFFFPDGDTAYIFAYNVDTGRWSEIVADPITTVIFEDATSSERHLSSFQGLAYYKLNSATSEATANLTTKRFQPNPNGRAFIREIRPLTSSTPAAVDIQIRSYNIPAGSSITSAGTTGTTSYFATTMDGRYFEIYMSAGSGESGFQDVFGVEYDFIPSGVY